MTKLNHNKRNKLTETRNLTGSLCSIWILLLKPIGRKNSPEVRFSLLANFKSEFTSEKWIPLIFHPQVTLLDRICTILPKQASPEVARHLGSSFDSLQSLEEKITARDRMQSDQNRCRNYLQNTLNFNIFFARGSPTWKKVIFNLTNS